MAAVWVLYADGRIVRQREGHLGVGAVRNTLYYYYDDPVGLDGQRKPDESLKTLQRMRRDENLHTEHRDREAEYQHARQNSTTVLRTGSAYSYTRDPPGPTSRNIFR